MDKSAGGAIIANSDSGRQAKDTERLATLSPFLLLLASIAFSYSAATVISPPEQVIRISLALTLLLGILTWLAQKTLRDANLSGILLTIFILGVCSPYLFAFVYLGLLMLTAVALQVYKIAAQKIMPKVSASQVALADVNILVSLILFLYYAIVVYQQIPNLPDSYYQSIDPKNETRFSGLEMKNPQPDIYVIVLDGYGRADMLKEHYQYDNAAFEQSLKAKGFIIPSQSYANYAKTTLSVPSMLNMDYIHSLLPGLEDRPNWWLAKPLITRSKARIILEQQGYQFVTVISNWGITNITDSDVYLDPSRILLNDFESFVLNSTPLSAALPLFKNVAILPTFDAHREMILYNFETLSKIPELPGPKFIFAHIIAPHPPFVLDAQGNPVEPDYPFSFNDANDFPHEKLSYQKQYIAQLQFVNKKVEALVDTLLNNSATPPIIILQADHGPGLMTDLNSWQDTCLQERFAVFSAYYLPGVEPGNVPGDLTPVNLFRVIFNEYMNAELPLLENMHYYSRDTFYAFWAEDVTEYVGSCSTR